ncbi:MAG: hypothetical protein BWY23_01236 [Spirochaetes bacterium ADurb.Bin218]|nr:MAG: hypothetical protein BWY23_01236 [Spirochaetes bacterium ADurb.Bin218]
MGTLLIGKILDCSVALLALINPISKIFIVSTLDEKLTKEQINKILLRSSLVALSILIIFIFAGNFILRYFFHIEIYSFKIAGGIVLFMRGLDALTKGIFFELKHKQKLEDMSIVPLASPMIAGPATITAAVSFPAHYGFGVTSLSMFVAIAINLLIMMVSPSINKYLSKHNITGALIRITGLFVATMGIQMILDGIREYISTL